MDHVRLAAVLTAVGAVSPGAVAIIAPIALGFAAQDKISPLLMGLLVIHGAQAGGFSPISIYGGITNGDIAKAGLPLMRVSTFLASFAVNLGVAASLLSGRRQLMSRRAIRGSASAALAAGPWQDPRMSTPPAGVACKPTATRRPRRWRERSRWRPVRGRASILRRRPARSRNSVAGLPDPDARGLWPLAVLTLVLTRHRLVAITSPYLSLISPNLRSAPSAR